MLATQKKTTEISPVPTEEGSDGIFFHFGRVGATQKGN